jgi:hypothetical protein
VSVTGHLIFQRVGASIINGSDLSHFVLATLLANDDLMLLHDVIGALGSTNDPTAVEPLLALLNQDGWFVRWYAVKALSALYHGGHLNETQAARLLEQCERVFSVHSDTTNCGENNHEYLKDAFEL